jgi:6-phosphogluconolactonase (cycloisomerase 2 family)
MKLSKLSQLFLVSSLGLSMAAMMTSCSLVSIDYVYVADSNGKGGNGQIETYAIDSDSGAIRSVASPVTTGSTSPVALAITSDYLHLYVANQGDNSIVHFTIAASGNITKADEVKLTTTPVALAVSGDNSRLYVLSGTTTATLTQYVLSSGVIGAATSVSLQIPGFTTDVTVPTGLFALPNSTAVFATAYDQSAYNPGVTNCETNQTACSSANPGWVFSVNTIGGSLGSPLAFQAGVRPSAVTADPTDRFVYVTDYASAQMVGYIITCTTSCSDTTSRTNNRILNYMIDGPFKTGVEPVSAAVDPRGKFLYVANSLDNSVSAYTLDISTGIPTTAINATGSSVNTTDTEPAVVAVDPALGRFVVTANQLGDSLSGFKLDPTAGTLSQSQGTPYPVAGYQPKAMVIAPHGNHATQTTTP